MLTFSNGVLSVVVQYIPNKRPISFATGTELALIRKRLNNRQRKRLVFKTPYELLTQVQRRKELRPSLQAK